MKIPWLLVWERLKAKPAVRARIERLNPQGLEEGDLIRGYYPARRLSKCWYRDIAGPKQFIAKNGVESYRAAKHLFFHEGHRKAITGHNCVLHGYRS